MTMSQHPSLAALRPHIEDLGFRKRAGWIFTTDLPGDVLGVIGLNTASQSPAGEILVNPVLGVRFQEVERLFAEANGEKFDEYRPPTYSDPLSTIAASVGPNDFVLDQSASDADVIDRLAGALREYGLPWMHKYASAEVLIDSLEPYWLNNQAWRARDPLLLITTGRVAEANEAAARALTVLEGRTDITVASQRAFFEWVTERTAAQD